MEAFEYLGSVVSGLVYSAFGFRLMRLGNRTQSAAERFIGSAFLLWGLYYALRIVSIGFQGQPALEFQIFMAARIVDSLGSVCFAFFPLSAFRRGSTWARWLATGIATCLIAGCAGSIWVGDPGGLDPLSNGWWWPEWFGEIASGIWIGVEGFHWYGVTRPRVRLGLCEPIVGHRFLLWGLAGILWTLLDFVIVGQYVEFWATQSWSTALDNLVGAIEISALAMIWLIYFTPATYQRKIDDSAASA